MLLFKCKVQKAKFCHCRDISILGFNSEELLGSPLRLEDAGNQYGSIYKTASGSNQYLLRNNTSSWSIVDGSSQTLDFQLKRCETDCPYECKDGQWYKKDLKISYRISLSVTCNTEKLPKSGYSFTTAPSQDDLIRENVNSQSPLLVINSSARNSDCSDFSTKRECNRWIANPNLGCNVLAVSSVCKKSCNLCTISYKYCLKYETATIEFADANNVAKVEVSFATMGPVTFVLDRRKKKGDEVAFCIDVPSISSLVQHVRIRQSSTNQGWAIKSLYLYESVGPTKYVRYAMDKKNPSFWVDGNADCYDPPTNGLMCCANKAWCPLYVVDKQETIPDDTDSTTSGTRFSIVAVQSTHGNTQVANNTSIVDIELYIYTACPLAGFIFILGICSVVVWKKWANRKKSNADTEYEFDGYDSVEYLDNASADSYPKTRFNNKTSLKKNADAIGITLNPYYGGTLDFETQATNGASHEFGDEGHQPILTIQNPYYE